MLPSGRKGLRREGDRDLPPQSKKGSREWRTSCSRLAQRVGTFQEPSTCPLWPRKRFLGKRIALPGRGESSSSSSQLAGWPMALVTPDPKLAHRSRTGSLGANPDWPQSPLMSPLTGG